MLLRKGSHWLGRPVGSGGADPAGESREFEGSDPVGESRDFDSSACTERFKRLQEFRNSISTKRFEYLLQIRELLGLDRFQQLKGAFRKHRMLRRQEGRSQFKDRMPTG